MPELPENTIAPRELQPGQRCEVWIASVTGERELVFTTGDVLLEAPNWTRDGAAFILNGAGKLWRFEVGSRAISQVPLTGVPDLNNDHVAGAGRHRHLPLGERRPHLPCRALGGGAATRLTDDDGYFHFLHGVSPDGKELAYVGIDAGDFTQPGRLMTIPAGGGAATLLNVDGHCDGPEYAPDGDWLYINTETFTSSPGHAQLARLRTSDGGARTNRAGTATDERHGRLVPAPLPGRALGQLHPVPRRHGGPPRGPGGRRRAGLNRRLDHTAALLAPLRRPGHPQRQQLVTGLYPVRLRRLPRRLTRPPGLGFSYDAPYSGQPPRTTPGGWLRSRPSPSRWRARRSPGRRTSRPISPAP